MRKITLLLVTIATLVSGSAFADQITDNLKQKLNSVIPNQTPKSISKTPIPGLYEANYGMQIYYISEDGNYIVDGEIINLATRTSLTSNAISTARKDKIAGMPADQSIIFPANGDTKHVITVFTDIDCGYCRKLHNQMAQYNDLGIEVRYMMFPRAGLQSDSFKKAVSAWCAEDNRDELTKAKNGKSIPSLECNNPIAAQYLLGQEVGVTGTPAIVTENGQIIPGYRKPADMLQALNQLAVAQ
jgi:Protein-disulfide isomerase